jgi:hypothetical protein
MDQGMRNVNNIVEKIFTQVTCGNLGRVLIERSRELAAEINAREAERNPQMPARQRKGLFS